MKLVHYLWQGTIALCLTAMLPTHLLATTYYVSAAGNDANNGTSTATPWKTLAKVSSTVFSPGDMILFNSGDTFVGQLVISSSGSAGNPIVYGKYGSGNNPWLAAQGATQATVYLLNKEYIEIKDMKITNLLVGNNINSSSGARLLGLHIINQDGGTKNHIYLQNLEVTNVNGEHVTSNSRYYGGVFFQITGSTTPSKWNDILVSNCYFHNISRAGVNFDSDWKIRSSTSTFGQSLPNGYTDNWVPSTNIVIEDNVFEHITGNGLIVRVAAGAIAQRNLFDYCGDGVSGNAAFCFNTDDFIFQYNEARNTVYNTGDTDARGFDVDYRTKNTIVQYNYLHDNGRGGFVATGGPENGQAYERFNVGTILRYNVIEDNHQQGIAFSGNCYDALVHNNVIFGSSTISDVEIVRIGAWTVYPHDIHLYNNIFWVKGSGAKFVYGDSRNIVYSHNLYHFSTVPTGLPVTGYNSFAHIEEDNFAVIGHPLFNNPGGSKFGYHLEPGSPAFNVGKNISQPTLDIYNNTIGSTQNIGVDQAAGVSTYVYQLDINHSNDITKDDFTGVLGTNNTAITINGTRFTMFGGIQGTRDRGTAGELTRDFAYNDGTGAGVGIRLENLPPGTYTVNTWHYDPGFPGLVNVEFREKGNTASTVVKAANHSLTSSASTSFTITVADDTDYEIIARENSSEDRSRFNGIRLTPVTSSPRRAAPEVVESLQVNDQLQVFPNPVGSRFVIGKRLDNDEQLTVTIYDIQGRTVYSKQQLALKGNWQLPLNKEELKLAKGIYKVTVAGKKTETVSILVY